MHDQIKAALEQISSFIYPNICLCCEDKGHAGIDLCESCYKNLLKIKFACERCAMPLAHTNAKACGACNNRKIYFDTSYAPFLFKGFIRESIYQFKFNNKLNHGKLLATLLAKQIQQQNRILPDVLVPVPLHKKRLRKRGFNQSLEIARILNKYLSKEISIKDIYRAKPTHVQMELPAKQRRANVKDAFKLRSSNSVFKDKNIVIIDDVMTTGSTVNEMAKCLKQSGAKHIDVWCVARVV